MSESEARGVRLGSVVMLGKSLAGITGHLIGSMFGGMSIVQPLPSLFAAPGWYYESWRLQRGKKESGVGYGVATVGLAASSFLYFRTGEVWSYTLGGIDLFLAGISGLHCFSAWSASPSVVVQKKVEPLEETINRLLGTGDALVVRKQFDAAREQYAEALREAQVKRKEFVPDVYAHLFCSCAAEAALLELEGGDGGTAAKRAMEYVGWLCEEKEVKVDVKGKDGVVKKEKMKKIIVLKEEVRQLRTLNPGEVYVRIHNFLSCYELQKSWQRKYHVNPFVIDTQYESSV